MLPFLFLLGCRGQCLIRTDSFCFLVVVSQLPQLYLLVSVVTSLLFRNLPIDCTLWFPVSFFLLCRLSICFLGEGLKNRLIQSTFCLLLLVTFSLIFIGVSSLQWMAAFVHFCFSLIFIFLHAFPFYGCVDPLILLHSFLFSKSCIIKK